ncbi:MAG: divergent PAP2 family protein [Lachnospiraceae bacterium]|nr:divergent PAP2 family protein [Lachnospiraceae bacterium]
MEFLRDMISNKAFLAALLGWTVAQVSKTIIYLIVNKELRLERMCGGGGMPSSHSATVCGLATATGMIYGGGSIEFAITFALAMIVMYDAMNVRMETGRQGKVLNDMLEIFQNMGKNISPEERLKELVGHTPLQVLIGAITGIIVAILVVLYL